MQNYWILILSIAISICHCCMELNVVVTCLPPMVICKQGKLDSEFPGFAVEFLNNVVQSMNSELICPISSVSILSSPSDLLSTFMSYNSSANNKLLLGINGVSDSVMTTTHMMQTHLMLIVESEHLDYQQETLYLFKSLLSDSSQNQYFMNSSSHGVSCLSSLPMCCGAQRGCPTLNNLKRIISMDCLILFTLPR